MGILCGFLIFVLGVILFRKLTCFYSRSKVCMVGKTALITGGAGGIGFQAAITLASKGCRVIIADVQNYAEAAQEIISKSHNPEVIGLKLDLGSFKSVRSFAKHINETETRLDILVNNAGIGTIALLNTEDGLNKAMQINYFGHFLLTHLLLDLLKKSAPSRIIFTSSIAAYFTDFDLKDMSCPKDTGLKKVLMGGPYGYSKICQAISAKMFAEKLKGTGVTANTFHPGGVRSKIFFKNISDQKSYLVVFLGLFTWTYGKNTEGGAQTLLHLAQADELKNISGKFFVEGRQIFQPPRMRDDDFCYNVWKKSIEFTKMLPHEIKC